MTLHCEVTKLHYGCRTLAKKSELTSRFPTFQTFSHAVGWVLTAELFFFIIHRPGNDVEKKKKPLLFFLWIAVFGCIVAGEILFGS